MVGPFQFVTHVRLPIIHTASPNSHQVTVPGIAKTAKMVSEFIIKVITKIHLLLAHFRPGFMVLRLKFKVGELKMVPLIKYLDIVWVKMSTYRWWPSEVTHPTEIPDKLEKMSNGPGEFVIRFLGTNEYYWCNQKRCFPYKGLMADPIAFQNYNNPSLYKTNGENDTTTDQQMKQLIDQMENKKGKSKQNDQFKLALVEAEDLFDTQKGYKSNAGSLPFHKLTVNSYYPRSDFRILECLPRPRRKFEF